MIANEMVVFYYIVKLKNFSQAAEKLKVSKAYVSKHVTQLEKELKARLLNRSTRQISLTEAGKIFFQHCQALVELTEKGYDAIANLHHHPAGTLKIAAPVALGIHILSDTLTQYCQKYPDVKLSVILESNLADIIQQGYDIALRSTLLTDSNLIAQKVATFSNILCASPAYLKKYGPIKHPNQLIKHVFAIYSSNTTTTKKLKFIHKDQVFHITIDGRFQINSLDLILQLVESDCCIAILPEFMLKTALSKKKLIHCLPDYKLPDSPLYAFYPEREFNPLKVKLFIDLLKANFSNI